MKRVKPDFNLHERYYTVKEAGPLLRLHPETVKLKCESGVIRSTKPGRRWLIPESALAEYLKERSVARPVW